MKTERWLERVLESLNQQPSMRRVKYQPGRCSICFNPKEKCWDTGEKPENDAARSAKGKTK